jgi:hypothetical protein
MIQAATVAAARPGITPAARVAHRFALRGEPMVHPYCRALASRRAKDLIDPLGHR